MIPPTGISAKLKDRRIDRMLERLGYEAAHCEIFYSPVMAWLTYLAILLATLLPFAVDSFNLIFHCFLYLCLLLPVGYLIVAYLNNSFVLVQHKLIVINPNFPFHRLVAYDLQEVRNVTIDQSRWLWLTVVFGHWGSNYVEISTDAETRRFYCTCLELDAVDENLTEKTIDDFHMALQGRNVPTEFNLD